MPPKCKIASLIVVTMLAFTSTARAIDDRSKGAARELANEAKREFDAGVFEEAARKFQRAYEIANVPTLAVWAARSLVMRGKLVAASELYRQATRLAPNELWVGNVQQKAQSDAVKELAEIEPKISKLIITIEGADVKDVKVFIDDSPLESTLVGVETPADPGRHQIVGRRGEESFERAVALGEGERREAVLRFTPPLAVPVPSAPETSLPAPVTTVPAPVLTQTPAPEPIAVEPARSPEVARPVTSPPALPEAPTPIDDSSLQSRRMRTLGWVTFSIGLAGLATGAVTGGVLMSRSGLRNNCPKASCDSSKVSTGAISDYNLLRNVSTAAFIVGGVGTVLGVTLLLSAPNTSTGQTASLYLGPTSVGIHGAF
jgi:hypothetical protein